MSTRGRPAASEERSTGALLRLLIAATVALPAFAVVWAGEGERVLFVLYRTPKLATIQVLGWLTLTAAFASHARWFSGEALARAWRPAAVRWLAALLAWLAAGGLWVRVRANHAYELWQYLLLFGLLLVLRVVSAHDPRTPLRVRRALFASLAGVTLVGLVQRFQPIPWLTPINPEIGAPNPSFMGYKNPMALALLGQIFLLAAALFDRRESQPMRRLFGVVLGAELLYLGTLGSRTSWVALGVGGLMALVLLALRPGSRRLLRRALGAAALAGLLIAAAIALVPENRERARTLVAFAADPATFLASDRGTYLLNTLHMVRYNPQGVGLGDWQTHYPVYRRHQRHLAFDDRHQVRRAHSDHVQMLGEGGWPGLFLWLAFLTATAAVPIRRFLQRGDPVQLLHGAQLAALATALATDYFVDLPYGKLELFLVTFLVLVRPAEVRPAEVRPEPPPALLPPGHTAGSRGIAALAATLTLFATLLAASTLARDLAAAHLTRAYLALSARPEEPAAQIRFLEAAAHQGHRVANGLGHSKTRFKDLLVLAEAARLAENPEAARALVARSLELYPYGPGAFALLAALEEDPRRAERWREIQRYLLDEAENGFERPYPTPGDILSSSTMSGRSSSM